MAENQQIMKNRNCPTKKTQVFNDWLVFVRSGEPERNTGKQGIATRRIAPESGEGKEKVKREEGQDDEEDEFCFFLLVIIRKDARAGP